MPVVEPGGGGGKIAAEDTTKQDLILHEGEWIVKVKKGETVKVTFNN